VNLEALRAEHVDPLEEGLRELLAARALGLVPQSR